MRNTPKDARAYFLLQPTITQIVGINVYCGEVPQPAPETYIWIARSGSDALESLGDAAGQEPFRQFLDVECISTEYDKSQAISNAVFALFPVAKGTTFGSATIQRAYANSQDDSYVSRNTARAEFTHFAALLLEVIP